jgi:hypothetical protein
MNLRADEPFVVMAFVDEVVASFFAAPVLD